MLKSFVTLHLSLLARLCGSSELLGYFSGTKTEMSLGSKIIQLVIAG